MVIAYASNSRAVAVREVTAAVEAMIAVAVKVAATVARWQKGLNSASWCRVCRRLVRGKIWKIICVKPVTFASPTRTRTVLEVTRNTKKIFFFHSNTIHLRFHVIWRSSCRIFATRRHEVCYQEVGRFTVSVTWGECVPWWLKPNPPICWINFFVLFYVRLCV